MTELPVTNRKNRHLLVINDHFSKFIQAYPVQERTAQTASTVVVDYFLRYGIPRKLYSDRDPSYESSLFQNVMRKLGVKKLRTTGYNPQGNGLTEQSNQTCKNYLTAYVNKKPENWDQHCRELSFAYNTSVHTSTGFTPANLFFGRKINVPLDLIFGSIDNEEVPTDFSSFRKRISTMYQLARE